MHESSLENLPIGLLALVLSYTEGLGDVVCLAQVNKSINRQLRLYWYELYRRDFPNQARKLNYDPNTNFETKYEEAFKEHNLKNNYLSAPHQKLFTDIRFNNLQRIKKHKWDAERDFTVFDNESNNPLLLAGLYERKAILDFLYEGVCK